MLLGERHTIPRDEWISSDGYFSRRSQLPCQNGGGTRIISESDVSADRPLILESL